MTFPPPAHLALYDPITLGGLAYPRSSSYYSGSEPDPYLQSNVSSLTSRLRDPYLKCDRNLDFNIDWATTFVVEHINKKTDAAETFRSVRIKAAALEREGLAEAIPYRIFNKLDETLFAGHLKNAVFLETSSLGSDVSGATYNQNWGPITGVQRVSVILNTDVLEYARARDIIAILIHHMIHAFFLVACGPQKEDEVDYGRLGHGYHFSKIMSSIKKLSAAHGKELTSLGVGYNLIDFPTYGEAWYKPRRRPSSDDRERKDKWYCSHCHADVYEIPDSDIDKWYDKTCKPMPEQSCKAIRSATVHIYNERRFELESKHRARLAPSSKTVEFTFKDKSVLVEKKKLEDLISVVLAFEKAKSRFLKIDHKEVSEATFLRFLEYVHTGRYRPDPTASNMYGRRGAPILKPGCMKSDAPLLADIHIAKFGTLMGWSECRSYALKRLDSYGLMSEDPIEVLEAIYAGREPDSKLKDWVRRFLVATPSSGSFSQRQHEQPNVLKLESEQGPWHARFRDAMERFGGLENEVRKAVEEVGGRGWMSGNESGFRTQSMPNMLTMGGGFQSPFQQQQQQLLLGGITGATCAAVNALSVQGNPLINALSQFFGSQNTFSNHNMLGNGVNPAYDLERQRRDIERERRRVERERDRLKETAAQVQAAAVLESMMGIGMGSGAVFGGWVEDEEYMQ